MRSKEQLFAAFVGDELVGRGTLAELVQRCKARLDAGERARIALFDDESGRLMDVDFNAVEAGGSPVVDATPAKRGPGRPKLGVVCREVSLLPRHWEWLAEQRGGASASLRRLVDAARRSDSHDAVTRRALDAAHRFIWDIAGDRPGFEEATRALYRRDFARLAELTAPWPAGIREQLTRYVERARGADQ